MTPKEHINNHLIKPMMKINLFTTYFISENKDRQRELDYAIVKNVDFFDTVNVIADTIDASKLKAMLTFKSKAEVRYFEKGGKPTFDDFFAIIAQVGKEDEINIIANSDIVFSKDEDYSPYFNWLKEYPQSCLALSRWDYNVKTQQFEHFNRADSQDVWVFYGVPKGINGAFQLGKAGIDNRMAHEIQAAGYRVLNPSVKFRTFHIHLTEYRTYVGEDGRAKETVPPPYLLVEPY